jgi:hypothetical protein
MTETTKIEKVIGSIRLHPFRTFLIGLVLIYLPVPILILPALTHYFDFSATGQIGDTIGGITAPILGLIGIWLVYLTFEEQRSANELQKDALKEQWKNSQSDKELTLIFELYGQARDEINELTYPENSFTPRNGVLALAKFGEYTKIRKENRERVVGAHPNEQESLAWATGWNNEPGTFAIRSGVTLVASTFLMLARQIADSKSISVEERQAHYERAQTLFKAYCGTPFKEIRGTLDYYGVEADFSKLILATETAFAAETPLAGLQPSALESSVIETATGGR